MGLETLKLLVFSQTLYLSGLQEANKYLQSPVLVYHDGRNDQMDVIIETLSERHAVTVASSPETPSSDNCQLPKSAVLIAKNPDALVTHLRPWSLWNGRMRVMVIAENESQVRNWITVLWQKARAVNVAVLFQQGQHNSSFYTWVPYQENDCVSVKNIVKITSRQLFSAEVKTPLNNCPLIAVTSQLPPLVMSESLGIESRLFLDLAAKLGMQASYTNLSAFKFVWSTLDAKGQPANGLKMVWENQVDMTFSQLSRQYASSLFAEFLPSHTQDESVFFAPGPKPAPRATAIYRCFTLETWILVLAASLAMLLLAIVISNVYQKKSSLGFLEVVALVLNLSAKLPTYKIFQYFAVVAYLYSMHITTMYQSSLIVFLSQVPRERAIRTWEDLDKSPFPVEFHEGQRPILNHISNRHIVSMLNRPNKGIFTPYLHMSHVAQYGNLAVLGPKLSFGAKLEQDSYFDEFGYPRVVVLDKNLFTSHLCHYVSKGHPLYPLMSHYMLELIEGGIPQHYRSEVTKLSRPVQKQQLRSFTVENVEGPFVLYGIMMVFCLLVWIVEICVGYCISKKRKSTTMRVPRTEILNRNI